MRDGWSYELVPLPDGRVCDVLLYGDQDRALVHHPGTPSTPAPDALLEQVSAELGLRIVIPLRPGYGRSTPNPGRRMADIPADVEAVLGHLGIRECVSAGYSGGGGHSLACAALAPSCKAAAVVVSPAPRDAEGLDYYAGMGQSNVDEWVLADQGAEVVRPWLEKEAAELLQPGVTMADEYDDSFPEVDKVILRSEEAAARMAAGLQKSLENGIEGWLEDDIALTTPWGFDLSAVTTPVAFWSGRQDQAVSTWHTAWLAQHVPGSDLHVIAAHGHVSLPRALMPEIIADLVRKAGWAPA